MWTMNSSPTGSMLPTTEAARCSSTKTPSPRRGKEDAFEKEIAGKWHVITLQETSEYVDHDILTNRFHVTHYGGCAILFNKGTFYPNIEVKSLYLHDTRRDLPDQVMEGQGWVMQGVLLFRRPPLSGHKTFTFVSLHITNIYAKKTWYWEKTHPHNSSRHAWRTCAPGCGRFQWGRVAMQQQKQHQYHWRSLCSLRVANAAWPPHHCGDQVRFQDAGPMCADS